MTLRISKVFTYDEDAGNYIQAIEAADSQALEAATRQAINNFVIGCKQDGIWTAIKASCILAGARTLAGALVPLVGAAPTNNNFVSGDYNRKTGLVGDGSTKYLNSNRFHNSDPQNNCHLALYASTLSNQGGYATHMGCNSASGYSFIRNVNSGTPLQFTLKTTGQIDIASAPGFVGMSRTGSAQWQARVNRNTVNATSSSLDVTTRVMVFCDADSSEVPRRHVNSRLAFYSIGESLNLALLDARVTTLINALGAAIP